MIANIQIQLQNIIKLAEVVNVQLVEIKMSILQSSSTYKIQMAGNIFSISEKLQSIIQEDMETQVYHIQTLLANKLDKYKEKENTYVDSHIKKIQNMYWNKH